MMGEERPNGTLALQIMLFSGPNSTGSPVDPETPDPLAPRKRDQSSAPMGIVKINSNERTVAERRRRCAGGMLDLLWISPTRSRRAPMIIIRNRFVALRRP